jgi:hypothetical protein
MNIRYSLIPVCLAFCIVCGGVTGTSTEILSNTPVSGTEPVIPVISHPEAMSPTEYTLDYAIIPDSPGIFLPVMPVQPIEAPATGVWALYLDPPAPGHLQPLPGTVPVPGNTLPDPSLLIPVRDPEPAPGQSTSRPVNGSGTIRWIDLEGGFYGIETDDGEQYLPLNLGEAFRSDGMRIDFSGHARTGTATIQMWGTPLEIHEITIIRDTISGTGTIRWIDLEGGFYGIETDDGEQYLPLNLGETYRSDGMRIRFQAYPVDEMSLTMWGIPVTLVSISAESGESSGVWMTYHRSGGIAGFDDVLTIYENGSAKISRRGEIRNIRLTPGEIDAIRVAGDVAGFPGLLPEYLPDGEGRDLFFYEITREGKAIMTADTAVPEELMVLIDLLNGIVARVPPL